MGGKRSQMNVNLILGNELQSLLNLRVIYRSVRAGCPLKLLMV
jgi:hypothetical protein